jgi:predicted amidohydrolase YtcJ
MKYIKSAAVIALAFLLASCSSQKFKVELVLTNGDFQTMNPSFPRAEAVAVDGGKIVGVGTTAGVQSHYEGKVTIDLQGAYVLPGLIDGHAHMLELGMSLQTVDLSATRSPQEVAKLVEEATPKARLGGWIRGNGWDASSWSAKISSVRGMLDKAAPDNFVFLVSADGGSVWVNGKVLDLAGITRTTRSPEGGLIIKDGKGYPTGILEGSAISLVTRKIPPPSEHEIEDAILLASDTCARYGITEVQDAGIDGLTLHAYKMLELQKKLRIRIYAMYDGNDSTLPGILKAGRIVDPNGYFTVRSVRVDMDGSLGSRRAALVREYSDAPGQFGATQLGEKDLENLTIASLSSGFQVCTEAHGDRANDIAINAYQMALEAFPVHDPRLRIEGADVLLNGDISRFKALGIIPSMQIAKCASDMSWIESRLGPDRIKNTFAWRSLLDSGSIIIGGSGFPEESPDPRIGIYSAVTRRDLNGLPRSFDDAARYFQLTRDAARDSLDFNGGFFPRQRMTLADALSAFTVWPAYGAFQENEKGKIAVGFFADFTVLQKDFNNLPTGEIPDDAILATIVGGHLVYISSLAANWKVL